MVAAAGVASASILNGLDCQTALRGSFGPQRLFGELSNRTASPLVMGVAPPVWLTHRKSISILPYKTGRPRNVRSSHRAKAKRTIREGGVWKPWRECPALASCPNADTIREMHAAFRQGGREAIDKVMRKQPAAFLKLLVLLVPREMKVEHSGGVKSMTDEELERGIEAIQAMLAARDAGTNAKVIEASCRASWRSRRPSASGARRTGTWSDHGHGGNARIS